MLVDGCRRNIEIVLGMIRNGIEGEQPRLEQDVTWGRFDAETGHIGRKMHQDLVVTEFWN